MAYALLGDALLFYTSSCIITMAASPKGQSVKNKRILAAFSLLEGVFLALTS